MADIFDPLESLESVLGSLAGDPSALIANAFKTVRGTGEALYTGLISSIEGWIWE